MTGGMTVRTPWTVYAGIDPGATSGLVAVAMPPGAHRLADARLVGFTTITTAKARKGDDDDAGKPRRRAQLFHRIREQLVAWRASVIVIEEPWDALASFGQGKRGKQGHGRGTLFSLGAHYGLVLAAASDLAWDVSIATYPVTSERRKERLVKKPGGGMMMRAKPERIGWMQRRNSKIPPHERVALECALLLRALKERPANGVLPSRADLSREEDDNVYMALGVLNFHLDRERGIV
jgi:hypothetical protein